MTETEIGLLRTAASFVAVVVAVMLQRLAPHARHRGSWRVNMGLWLVDTMVVGAICGGCAFTAARWATVNGFGMLNQAGVATSWVAVPATLVVLDLVSYAWHRANHAVPFLWRFHQVHHADPRFTVSTGLRFHPGELLLSLPLRLAAVVVLGAPVVAVLLFEAIFTLANVVEHADMNVPRGVERELGRVIITPALHRRHHTRERPDRDSNFGTLFSLWDRLCRTYGDNDSSKRIETGLPGLSDITLRRALVLPLWR